MEGYENLRRVLLGLVDSSKLLSAIFRSKASKREKLELISSIGSFRDFLLDPSAQIQIS